MTTQEQLDRLTGIVDSLASSVVAHDNQIEALIEVAAKHSAQIAKHSAEAAKHSAQIAKHSAEIASVTREIREVTREWQAYLRRLPAQ